MTTVGNAIKVLSNVIINPRPLNVEIPIKKPTGTPAAEARRIAEVEILSEVKVMSRTSRSKVIMSLNACITARQKYSIFSNSLYHHRVEQWGTEFVFAKFFNDFLAFL